MPSRVRAILVTTAPSVNRLLVTRNAAVNNTEYKVRRKYQNNINNNYNNFETEVSINHLDRILDAAGT